MDGRIITKGVGYKMMKDNMKELSKGLGSAFFDRTINSNLAYKPQFIYNDNKNGQKVFSAIEDELLRCDRFAISVAFITRGGITPLLQTLKELEKRGSLWQHLNEYYQEFLRWIRHLII